jgi:hypothetical protein
MAGDVDDIGARRGGRECGERRVCADQCMRALVERCGVIHFARALRQRDAGTGGQNHGEQRPRP